MCTLVDAANTHRSIHDRQQGVIWDQRRRVRVRTEAELNHIEYRWRTEMAGENVRVSRGSVIERVHFRGHCMKLAAIETPCTHQQLCDTTAIPPLVIARHCSLIYLKNMELGPG